MRPSKELRNNLNHFPTTVFICSWKIMIARRYDIICREQKSISLPTLSTGSKGNGTEKRKNVFPLYYLILSISFSPFISREWQSKSVFPFSPFSWGWRVDFEVKSKDPVTFWINLIAAVLWTQCFYFLSLLEVWMTADMMSLI